MKMPRWPNKQLWETHLTKTPAPTSSPSKQDQQQEQDQTLKKHKLVSKWGWDGKLQNFIIPATGISKRPQWQSWWEVALRKKHLGDFENAMHLFKTLQKLFTKHLFFLPKAFSSPKVFGKVQSNTIRQIILSLLLSGWLGITINEKYHRNHK